jgi:putative transposase
VPCRPRLILPNIPLHITQRGVNRAAIFIDDEDRHHYRKLLGEACTENVIAVHALVLMDNHVPLLLTPSRPEMLAVAMRAVGQSYVQFFNYRHGRSGTLWQGRFKSCLVDSDRYALTVCRYIEWPHLGR